MPAPKRNRPDHDGKHRPQYERNKKIVFATQTHCAICGRPVDFDIKYPDPMAPTVDHVVPISRGGHPSALDNLQLAHFICNQQKGKAAGGPRAPKVAPPPNRALALSADWKTF